MEGALKSLKEKAHKGQLSGYLFIAPALAIITVLVAYPFLKAILLSFTDSTVGKSGEFVGLANYARLWGNETFRQTLQNSLIYTVFSVGSKTILGLGLALLLNRTLPFKKFIRGIILLPWVIPSTLSTLGWLWMFDPIFSVINWAVVRLGLVERGLPWLSDPYLAMASIIVVNTWRGLPFFAITLLAGLVSIPTDLYRAAKMDGAGPIRTFFHVTLPLLKPLLLVVILFSTIMTISDFNIVYILTKGGPMNMTHLLSTLSFQIGLSGGRLGQGAAVSLFLFPVLAVVVYFQLKAIRMGTTYD